jgi:hypothetical protein
MALIVGQMENLSNSELQKQFIKDKAKGKEQVWQKRSYKNHLNNLRNLHEGARGKHGNIKRDS